MLEFIDIREGLVAYLAHCYNKWWLVYKGPEDRYPKMTTVFETEKQGKAYLEAMGFRESK